MSTEPTSPPSPLTRLISSGAFWGAMVVLVVALALGRAFWSQPPELPVLGTLPAFSLTDEGGSPFGSAQLQGKVWVANFIFTRCPDVCPVFTRKMATVQERTRSLGDRLHLVSFSVDPEYDTPQVLAKYAGEHHADPRRWSFLTGSAEAIRATVVDGLKSTMGRAPDSPSDDLASIFHGTHFVLVDSQMRIRGYYRMDDADVLDRLVRDASALAQHR